ncbi:MAG: antibiotic transport system ATP-binding protein [Bacillota bacterium]|nr:MAG: antibiotic transport system ATP-binding protein [Bacillota bacterium]
MKSLAIMTDNLTKHYRGVQALTDLSLAVEQGSIFGFLGANGAGKTTSIRLLLGLIRPTSGSSQIFGLDAQTAGVKLRSQVGYLPGELSFYTNVSGQEVLDMLGSFYKSLSWRKEACEAMEMSEADLWRKTREYSTGMKQKLGIIQAVQHAPPLLILDEPTRGLDPLIQRNFFELMERINKRGTTIFMSTHVLTEVERLCANVGIIRAGRLLVVESVANIRKQRIHRLEVVFSRPVQPPNITAVKISLNGQFENSYAFETSGNLEPLLSYLSQQPVDSIVCERAKLDDIFLHYYAKEGIESRE